MAVMNVSTAMQTAGMGLGVAGRIVEIVAGNVANLYSEHASARQVLLSPEPGGAQGVKVGTIREDPSAPDIGEDGVEGSNIDLPREMVELIKAAELYRANLEVLRRAETLFEQTMKAI